MYSINCIYCCIVMVLQMFFFWLLYINFDSTHNLVFLYKLLHIFILLLDALRQY